MPLTTSPMPHHRPLVTIRVIDEDDPDFDDELDCLGPIGGLPLPYIHELEHEYGPRLLQVVDCQMVAVH